MPRERVPVAVCVCKTFCGPTRNDCSSKQREANDIPVDDVGIFQSSFDGGMEGGVRLSRWHGDGGGFWFLDGKSIGDDDDPFAI